MATTMLKPGGYQRLEQIGRIFEAKQAPVFEGVDAAKVRALVEGARTDKHHVKAVKPQSGSAGRLLYCTLSGGLSHPSGYYPVSAAGRRRQA